MSDRGSSWRPEGSTARAALENTIIFESKAIPGGIAAGCNSGAMLVAALRPPWRPQRMGGRGAALPSLGRITGIGDFGDLRRLTETLSAAADPVRESPACSFSGKPEYASPHSPQAGCY